MNEAKIDSSVSLFPTTESQREIWTTCQLGADAALAYSESVTLILDGSIDVESMKLAIHDLIRRHEAFRMTFTDDGLNFWISESVEVEIPTINVDQDECALSELKKEAVSTPFDLVNGPLFKTSILFGVKKSYVIITAHHMVCDGWSTAILLRDLGYLYTARATGQPPSMTPAPSFCQFATSEAAYLDSQEAASDAQYWKSTFADAIPVMDIPCDQARPKLRSFNSSRVDQIIAKDVAMGLKKIAAKERASFFMALLGAYQVLLWKILGDEPVVTAVPTAAQAVNGLFDLVGHCVNTLPITTLPLADEPFANFLKRTRQAVLNAYDHQRTTFGRILQYVNVERDPSRIPLSPIIFNVDKKFDSSELNYNSTFATYESNPRIYDAFEIFVNIAESNGICTIECQYNSVLFSKGWIESHLQSYTTLLQAILLRPTAPLKTLGYAPVSQLDEQYFVWNQKSISFTEESIIPLFEKTALDQPQKVAVVSENSMQTYEQLAAQSNQWANCLSDMGVRPGDFVGVGTERTIDLLAVLLGIFKAGACYVPMDPNYPQERLRYMMAHTGCKIVLSTPQVVDSLPKVDGCRLVNLADCSIASYASTPSQNAGQVKGGDLAYVTYTSGSTGLPKGVMVPHKGIVNLMLSMAANPGLTAEDTLLAVTTLSFDMSVVELYLPLVVGATIILANMDEVGDGVALSRLIADHEVTVLQATPATWRLLLESGWKGAPIKAITGGEALSRELADSLIERVTSLWNYYGPTEITVYATGQQIHPDQPIGIGAAIDGASLYVIDRYGLPVPRFIPGELLIGGTGVTKGYLGRADLTAERFIHLCGIPDLGLLYRSGDLVRFKNGPNLEYIGRNDNQVKVRGFRIELGEIEAVISRHKNVSNIVVLVREDGPMDQCLVGYAETTDREVTETVLIEWCRAFMPAYMVPQRIVVLEQLPLLPNGKINRKALVAPSLDISLVDREDELRGLIEEEMAAVWGNILGMEKVPATKSFYTLGGHSILAMRMLSQLQKSFGVAVPLRTLLENNSVRALANVIAGAGVSAPKPIPMASDGKTARLSIIQERVYYLDLLNPNEVINLLPDGRIIRGPFDPDVFATVIETILQRHPMMRGIVASDSVVPMMHVKDEIELDLRPQDLTHLAKDEQDKVINDYCWQMTSVPLDVHKENLFRFKLFKLQHDVHHFATVFHHLIWDGWCFDIFWSEVHTLYLSMIKGAPAPLAEPGCRYLDFSIWHRNISASSEYLSQLPFWIAYLKGFEYLELPTDLPRPARRQSHGKRQQFIWDKKRNELMLGLAKEEHTTIFVVMLSLFKYLLSLHCDQDDIIVATPVQGRGHPDFANVIGYFVNTLVLRTELKNAKDFREVIRRVKASAEGAFRNQDVAFEDIVKALDLKPDPSRTTLYSAMFAYQDTSNRATDWEPLRLEQVNLPQNSVGTDLVLWVRKDDAGLTCGFDYRTDLFSDKRISELINHLTLLLDSLTETPSWKVYEHPILPPSWAIPHVSASRKSTLMEMIMNNAQRRGDGPFISSPSTKLTGYEFVGSVQMLCEKLNSHFDPKSKLTIKWAGEALDCSLLIAAEAQGFTIRLERRQTNQETIVMDERGNTLVINDKFIQQPHAIQSPLGGDFIEATLATPQGDLKINQVREARQFAALGSLLAQARKITANLSTASIEHLRWIHFGLALSDEIYLQNRPEDNSYALTRFLKNAESNCEFLTIYQLANLCALGFLPDRDKTYIVSGAGVGQGILRIIQNFERFYFVAADQLAGSWFAVGSYHEEAKDIVWQGVGSPISVVKCGRSIPNGPFMRGVMSVADSVKASWSGYSSEHGLLIDAPASRAIEERDHFAISHCEQLRQFRKFESIFWAEFTQVDDQRFFSLLVSGTPDSEHFAEIAADINKMVPAYLMPKNWAFIDLLPTSGGGILKKEHRIFATSTSDRVDVDEPLSYAEMSLATIWSKVLGVKKIRRHDNFFDLGGYSLLPLLVINEVEKVTGKRLDIGVFLTQSLSSIALQCGFDQPVSDDRRRLV